MTLKILYTQYPKESRSLYEILNVYPTMGTDPISHLGTDPVLCLETPSYVASHSFTTYPIMKYEVSCQP